MTAKLKLVGKEPETILPYRRGESASEIAERIRLGVRREPMCRTILGGPVGQPALAPSGAKPVPRLGATRIDRAHG
jgi:hypothetical protein